MPSCRKSFAHAKYWPEVTNMKHQRRRLVVDATTFHDKTTTKLVTMYPDGSVRSGFEPVAGCFYNVSLSVEIIGTDD
jgi:predicted site-specific integrase-resolvase